MQPSPRAIKVLRVAALALIVAVACVRVARTWAVFSATADEPQHIAAGIEWWGRADVVQHEPWRTVNPPLARIAVGLGPYLAGTRSTPFLRDTLYTGPGYERNLLLSRPGVLPFLALTIVLTWVLARRAYGEATGWIAAVIVSCTPAILGHAGLATTDVAFTATFLLALLALLRWIEQPTWGRALLGGLAIGLAAATKFSALVLPAFALVAAVARRSLGPRPGSARRMLGHAPVMGLVAFAVVWAAYRFAVAAPASLWQAGWLDDTLHACLPSEGRRHAAEWLLAHRLPAPAAFLALFELCGQEAPGRSTSYLLGQLTQDGFPAFFLIALAVKTPLPVIALAAFGFFALVFNRGDAGARFRALAPVLAAAVFLAAVIRSRHNIGVRHVLPVMALLALPAAHGAVTAWRATRRRIAGRIAAGAALRVDRRAAVRDRARLFPVVQRARRKASRERTDRQRSGLGPGPVSAGARVARSPPGPGLRRVLRRVRHLPPRAAAPDMGTPAPAGAAAGSRSARPSGTASTGRTIATAIPAIDRRWSASSGQTPRSTTGSTPTSRWPGSAPRSCSTTLRRRARTRTARPRRPEPSRDSLGY